MIKLVALFTHPADPAAFDLGFSRWLPLSEAMPGLRRVAVSHVQGSPDGATPYYLIHEMFFDDLRAAHAAMSTPEGDTAARQLWSFAIDNVTLFFADHLEENKF